MLLTINDHPAMRIAYAGLELVDRLELTHTAGKGKGKKAAELLYRKG